MSQNSPAATGLPMWKKQGNYKYQNSLAVTSLPIWKEEKRGNLMFINLTSAFEH